MHIHLDKVYKGIKIKLVDVTGKTFDKKEDVIKETEQNKTEGKIDYGYTTAAIILGIFLIWWVFLK